MIKEAYVSFEVARLLKEKGFDGACNRVYQGPKLKYTTLDISPLMCLGGLGGFDPKQLYVTNSELGDIVYAAPTHQMAIAWLREEYKIAINIRITCKETISYAFDIWDFEIIHPNEFVGGTIDLIEQQFDFKSYEEAVEAALEYSLENLI